MKDTLYQKFDKPKSTVVPFLTLDLVIMSSAVILIIVKDGINQIVKFTLA